MDWHALYDLASDPACPAEPGEAAQWLNAPGEPEAGMVETAWLDSYLLKIDRLDELDQAAEGQAPNAALTEAQRQLAGRVARAVRHVLRHHPYLDTALPQVTGSLDVLVLAGVLTSGQRQTILQQGLHPGPSRAQAAGLPPVTPTEVAEARRLYGGD